MPDAPVVVNNTPLVALWSLGRLSLLRDLFEEVWVPPGVSDEFLATETPLRQAALNENPWIKTVPLTTTRRVLTFTGLDRGEAEVLALAEERSARLVILDERKGRRWAQRLGLPLTGTVGLLLLAKEAGLLAAVAPCLEELQKAGLYLDDSLVKSALKLAGEAS